MIAQFQELRNRGTGTTSAQIISNKDVMPNRVNRR